MVELNCQTCGNNRFDFPDDPAKPVTCQFCGESVGIYAEVAERIADSVMTEAKAGQA